MMNSCLPQALDKTKAGTSNLLNIKFVQCKRVGTGEDDELDSN